MAKPNYQFEKRQRDLAKKNKQEEKRRQKLAGKAAVDNEDSTVAIDSSEAAASNADNLVATVLGSPIKPRG